MHIYLKNVGLMFNPTCKQKCLSRIFPKFTLNTASLNHVSTCKFKYLSHMINNKLSDDDDIER